MVEPRANRNAYSSCKTGNHRLSSRLADAGGLGVAIFCIRSECCSMGSVRMRMMALIRHSTISPTPGNQSNRCAGTVQCRERLKTFVSGESQMLQFGFVRVVTTISRRLIDKCRYVDFF